MVNTPKYVTTSLGCLGALLTVVIAFSAFFTATEQAQLPGERVEAAVFSPNGKTLYGAGSIQSPEQRNGTLQAWDVQTGKLLWRHLHQSSASNHISLSHDGKTLLLPVGLRFYDARTGQQKPLTLAKAPPLATYSTALFTQDDKEIIAVAGDGCAPVVLDATTGKLKRKLHAARGPEYIVSNIALSPNGKQLVFQQSNQLVLRDLVTDKTLGKQTIEETYHTTPFRFLPDGKRFQCGDSLWTPGTPGLRTDVVSPSSSCAAYSPDGSSFVSLEYRGGKNQRYPLGTILSYRKNKSDVTLAGQTGW